jgi:hypothetical protein
VNTTIVICVAAMVYLAAGLLYARHNLVDSYQQGERSRMHSLKSQYTAEFYGTAFAEERADERARLTRNLLIRMDILFWPFIGIAAALRRWFAAPVTRHNERIAQLKSDITHWESQPDATGVDEILKILRERLAELDGK